MKKFIVDRIEGDKAVLECENGDMVNLELKALPKSIKEGDVINFHENSYFLNSDETKARKEKIKNLMNSLLKIKNHAKTKCSVPNQTVQSIFICNCVINVCCLL